MSDQLDPDVVAFFRSLGVDADDVPADVNAQTELASDAVIGRGDRHSLRDIAGALNREIDELAIVLRELGVRVDDVDETMFADGDLDLLHFIDAATEELLLESEGIEILNVIGSALETLAEAAIAGHVQGPESRLADEAAHLRLNAQAAELGIALGGVLPAVFRHHLRQSAHRQRRTQNREHRELVELAVGFVDLVGFTPLSRTLTPRELVDLVRDFESAAHGAARRHDARVAKLIGDEVMFVAESAGDAVSFATDLLATFRTEAVVPRGGIATGSIVTLHGDYFGPVVNVAARLVDEAVPGELLVTEAIAVELPNLSAPSGRRMLKGFADPLPVWSISPDR